MSLAAWTDICINAANTIGLMTNPTYAPTHAFEDRRKSSPQHSEKKEVALADFYFCHRTGVLGVFVYKVVSKALKR